MYYTTTAFIQYIKIEISLIRLVVNTQIENKKPKNNVNVLAGSSHNTYIYPDDEDGVINLMRYAAFLIDKKSSEKPKIRKLRKKDIKELR